MTNFKDLVAWQKSRSLNRSVYKLVESFPSYEQFALSAQTRRSSISVSSNIAEGFGRESVKDKLNFYVIARGSLYELHSQLVLALDCGYITEKDLENLERDIEEARKVLIGLIKSTKKTL